MSADLAAAIVTAVREYDQTHAALLDALTACVCSLRDDSAMAPESVVLTMKAVLRHAARSGSGMHRVHPMLVDQWMDELITWCIQEYFRNR